VRVSKGFLFLRLLKRGKIQEPRNPCRPLNQLSTFSDDSTLNQLRHPRLPSQRTKFSHSNQRLPFHRFTYLLPRSTKPQFCALIEDQGLNITGDHRSVLNRTRRRACCLVHYPESIMAANQYYNTSASNHHVAHQHNEPSPPSPPPSSAKPPTSLYTNYRPSRASYVNSPHSATASIDSPYGHPHYSRDSYYQDVAGGTFQDDRQYADNIPLKSPHTRPYSEDNLVGQNTQYPPPESQHPPKSSRRRKRKQGWFTGKITWVVFLATLVQFGVFIGEIVMNGESHESTG